MKLIQQHFPELSKQQIEQFSHLQSIYTHWNEQINVISRKDMEQFYERHVLHSLSIGLYYKFSPGQEVLDLGTGGGFPGIPLAILFPDTTFHLVDSIGKKIKVVKGVIKELGLKNVTADQERVENLPNKYDIIVTRAVAHLTKLIPWVNNKLELNPSNPSKSGIICLKGGDLTDELRAIKWQYTKIDLKDTFKSDFFETKNIIHVYPSKK